MYFWGVVDKMLQLFTSTREPRTVSVHDKSPLTLRQCVTVRDTPGSNFVWEEKRSWYTLHAPNSDCAFSCSQHNSVQIACDVTMFDEIMTK